MHMSKNKALNEMGEKGVILFTSSINATEGATGLTNYSASKGAISGMVLPMARDLGRYGIRVVSINPGMFDTPLADPIPKE